MENPPSIVQHDVLEAVLAYVAHCLNKRAVDICVRFGTICSSAKRREISSS